MQLAILLSLIHTRGASLPDKRTALYDSYISLFFDREAEKSEVVREYRELLSDVHGYLAWVLHSEGEQGRHRGSVNAQRLHELIVEYLKIEGRDVSLVTQLFPGMVERVVFLVSRVEGTYEFEVQPLREYFAARFLYETAPYSPPGAEKRGTKPDRFDALARNFHWLNVTRFFAGCFSKGELPALIDRLDELVKTEGYRNTTHPRRLAAMLLADWVFSQHQRSTQQAVAMVLGGLSLGRIFAGASAPHLIEDEPLALPEGCGRRELIEECISILAKSPPDDYTADLTALIRVNGIPEEIDGIWLRRVESTRDEKRERWFDYGLRFASLARCSVDTLHSLLSVQPPSTEVLLTILEGGKSDVIYSNPEWCKAVADSFVAGKYKYNPDGPDVLSRFGDALTANDYSEAFRYSSPIPLRDILRHRQWRASPSKGDAVDEAPDYEVIRQCRRVVEVSKAQRERRGSDWVSSIEPWEKLVEACREYWGDRWQFYVLSNLAAGVRDADLKCQESSDLFDRSRSLCRRARYARLRIGSSLSSTNWWQAAIGQTRSAEDRMFIALLFWTWATFASIVRVVDEVEVLLEGLSGEQFEEVCDSVVWTTTLPFRRDAALDIAKLPGVLSPRFVTLLGARVRRDLAHQLYLRHLKSYAGSDQAVSQFIDTCLGEMSQKDPRYWQPLLKVARRHYRRGACGSYYEDIHHMRMVDNIMPIDVAEEIAKESNSYPRQLAHMAALRCRSAVATKIVPLGTIAERDRWFAEMQNA